jgi:hypothetical protein
MLRPQRRLFEQVVRRRGPWRSVEDVESATFESVWWFNYHRLLGTIGHVPPAELERAYYTRPEAQPEPPDSTYQVSDEPGGVQVELSIVPDSYS